MSHDFGLNLGEAMWLADPKHEHFKYRPATIREFCGAEYLDIAQSVRPGVMDALVEIFGDTIDTHLISASREALFTGGIGIGKQLRLDELVLTPRGWTKNRDLNVGDFVVGSNGRPTEVLGVYDHEDVQMYRMHFKDGTWIDSGDEHLWEVWYRSSYGKYRSKVASTEELYTEDLRAGSSWKYHIPLVDPVEYDPVELPCDPYTVGAFIANGSMHSGTPKLGCHVSDVTEFLEYIDWSGTRWSWDSRPGGAGGSIVFAATGKGRHKWSNPLASRLNEAGIYHMRSRDKRVPELYMLGSVDQRTDLLRGLMDCDGHVTKSNATTYATSSEGLANDVAALVRSLGGYCTITSFVRKGATEYQVHVNTDQLNPFRLERKSSTWQPRTNQRPRRSIVGIDKLEKAQGRCIKVAAADELYVTKDFIVTHNTTLASIALPYMVHWVQCLKDPQEFYGLMSGSRIAFMMMSTSERQARDVLFDDVKARIDNSPWFKQYSPRDTKFDTRIKFPNDIFIIPGGSEETQFEGYNILGGILDEGDSHKSTARKNYAMEGWNTISSRISSRFTNPTLGCHMGLILAIGQKKSNEGFMAKKSEDLRVKSGATVVTMTIWESLGWYNFTDNPSDAIIKQETGNRKSFFFDTMRKEILPKEDVPMELRGASHMIEVPMAYFSDFLNDPVKALRDLAGIPPAASDPFIPQVDRIIEGYEGWHIRYGDDQPVGGRLDKPEFADWFRATDALPRSVHIDLAYSGDGDALGMAMGHVAELVDTEEEEKPLIVFDFLLRMKAKSGQEIMLSDVRKMVYDLKFHRGFNIKWVTMDGFNTTDTMQQFHKKKINAAYLSVDKSKLPFTDLREAIYERRCLFPKYMVKYQHSDEETDLTNIAYRELSQLSEGPRKIDHPPTGSKDVADCMAGVVHNLMNSSQARRGAGRPRTPGGGMDEADVKAALARLSVPRRSAGPQEENYKPASFEDFLSSQSGKTSGVPHANNDEHLARRMVF